MHEEGLANEMKSDARRYLTETMYSSKGSTAMLAVSKILALTLFILLYLSQHLVTDVDEIVFL